MVRTFLKDIRGSYTIATVISMVPLLGGLALAIDFTEMNRQRQATFNALDAAGIATARRVVEGATDEELMVYAKDFFNANLGPVDPGDTALSVVLPTSTVGGGTLKMSADLEYRPYFYHAFVSLLKGDGSSGDTTVNFNAKTEIRLKNTLEVALALDNSGSMDIQGTGSGKKRIDLLKEAAKQLVDAIAKQGAQMKQIAKPVQFALTPFAASVNVGPDNAGEPWMDGDGISPVHHENFDWRSFDDDDREIKKSGGIFYKKGEDWGDEEDEKVTRFTLFDELKNVTGTKRVQTGTKRSCTGKGKNQTCTQVPVYADVPVLASFASWGGCVETRPYPYNTTDDASVTSTPATLFVPMFAPDETDQRDSSNRPSNNNWWRDDYDNDDDDDDDDYARDSQRYMPKYFQPAEMIEGDDDDDVVAVKPMGLGEGPNASCTTVPMTPLVDISTSAGLAKIKDAIDEMTPLGGTNVPEGLAWGWKAVSGRAPFSEGRGDNEKGNDKVVIVLTDGENTYYTPGSVRARDYSGGDYWEGAHDLAGNKSLYSAFGYTGQSYDGGDTRLFDGASSAVGKSDYSNGNYGKALNEQMAAVCGNAKAGNIIVMTVALDLDPNNEAQKKQIEGLKACASDSRFRKDPTDPTKAEKLFWNTTGGDLAETFKKIADELSNLRIVG